ncbi:HAMP domain-containing histidine kinase [Ginsengibacter hankyongi]|uniref:histidine kinase n=1 Tax=Ginsengibacter hankyongi TaxID=2607284 RepID=A0A5J5IJS8_9BACT|nr:HAMP domain-containing sensor histidine kinase [Ginsengibacter hankyongi]KAA9038625.1 HAMP domain-containing histidine kinase [Ginsengibacter hankyongi]
MKLLAKYNRVNVVATIIVLLLSAVIYYFFIEKTLVYQLDKNLVVEEKEIKDYIIENNALPEPSYSKDEQEVYTSVTDKNVKRSFSSVELYNKDHDENIDYRQLEFPVTVNGKFYKADVRKSQEETEDVVQLILKITLTIVLLLLAILFIINRFVLSKLWKPFNSTLEQIKQFNVSGKDNIHFEPSNINEFTELNAAVNVMTKKAIGDYNEIKSFTENASHEIQTPLAIIRSKLELLSQSENLKEEQMNAIQSISETTSRLSKLNQSLILLTKIDNRQFKETEDVNLSVLLHRHLNNYEELLNAKGIVTTKNIAEPVFVTMNETLAETLIVNLLTNAIKHNVEKGSITITLNEHALSISNTGKALNENPAIYFERFKKESASNDSMGLGLSIVKKICDTYHFTISYTHQNMMHTVTVNF